jgi:glycosyltransferase involved in cell wall biosynthesis
MYVIVDDGSTDDTQDVARDIQCGDPELVAVVRCSNRGLPGARNAGIIALPGVEWIVFVDADDWLEPNFIEACLDAAGDAGVVMTRRKNQPGGGFYTPNTSSVWGGGEHSGNSCAMIRRDALAATGGYNPRMWDGDEDLDLWIDLAARGCTFALAETTWYNYRMHTDSWTATVSPERIAAMRAEMERHRL